MRPLLCVLLVLAAGCEPRRDIDRIQAVNLADHLQLREGLEWGAPVGHDAPTEASADGRRWWRIRYAAAPDGTPRFILVDAGSGWARLPRPGSEGVH